MAYEKKPNYPSLKKPGVYPSGSLKELGLELRLYNVLVETRDIQIIVKQMTQTPV